MKTALVALSALLVAGAPALAQQDVAEFYKGKTIRISSGSGSARATTSTRGRSRAISPRMFRQSDRDRAEPAGRRQA